MPHIADIWGSGTRDVNLFISYARDDAEWTEQLRDMLRDSGFSTSLDRTDPGADNWEARIAPMIEGADAIVLVLTDAALRSPRCAWEAARAKALGKAIVPVLPAELASDAMVPPGLAALAPVHFYPDPRVPGSGFYDGQRRLTGALRRLAADAQRQDRFAQLPPARSGAPPRAVLHTPAYRPAPAHRRRLPIFQLSLAALIAGLGFAVAHPDIRARLSEHWREVQTLFAEASREEPTGAAAVSAQDYTPDRGAFAGPQGANVRDYPLLSGDLVAELPARTPLNITGRLNVQGRWWFRVALADGRIGFVREDAVRLGPPPSATARYRIESVEPPIAAMTGPAGARLRRGPSLRAGAIVRLSAGVPVSVTGRVRQGAHWWLHLELADGRTGFAREDVLRTPENTPILLN